MCNLLLPQACQYSVWKSSTYPYGESRPNKPLSPPPSLQAVHTSPTLWPVVIVLDAASAPQEKDPSQSSESGSSPTVTYINQQLLTRLWLPVSV